MTKKRTTLLICLLFIILLLLSAAIHAYLINAIMHKYGNLDVQKWTLPAFFITPHSSDCMGLYYPIQQAVEMFFLSRPAHRAGRDRISSLLLHTEVVSCVKCWFVRRTILRIFSIDI